MRSTLPWRTLPALALLSLAVLALPACSPADDAGTESAGAEAADRPAEPGTAKADPETLDLAETVAVFVLPAPSEIAAAVEGDVAFDLERLGDDPLPSYEELEDWQAALAVGRVVADLLIAAPRAPIPDLVGYLDNLELGLRSLGIAQEELTDLRELRAAIAEGAMGRDELIDRFDDLRVEILREGKTQLGDRTMALVATGGWARAVNLVAERVQATDRIPAGSDALKLRLVVATLIDRLGSGTEVRPVVESLQAILPLTAQRPTEPTSDELATLIAETEEILALTRAS